MKWIAAAVLIAGCAYRPYVPPKPNPGFTFNDPLRCERIVYHYKKDFKNVCESNLSIYSKQMVLSKIVEEKAVALYHANCGRGKRCRRHYGRFVHFR